MVEQISIVIIDSDEAGRDYIKELLQKVANTLVKGEAADAGDGYELVRETKPQVVILDVSVDPSLKLAENIFHNFPQTVLLITSLNSEPNLILRAMRCGAREFLPKPINEEDFLNAFKTVVRFHSQKKAGENKPGKIITVFGARGGVGTTTTAINLATNFAAKNKDYVILMDMNLQLGNSALFLNLKPNYSITEIAYNIDEIDVRLFKDTLPQHSSGVYLLAGPYKIEEAETIHASQLEKVLTLLKSMFDYVVIDTHKFFDEFTIKALDASDSILVLFTADIPSMYNTRRCLDIIQRLGYGEDKVKLVANRCDATNEIELEEFEKTVNYPIFWRIPNQDYETIKKSINLGKPLSEMVPRSKTSLSFRDLSYNLGGMEMIPGNGENKKEIKKLFKKMIPRKKGSL
jgi:pilus assembly protein CpaE